MRKNLTYIIYTLLIVGTIVTLYIVYTDFDTVLASKFVVGYAIFLILSFLYFMVVIFIHLKNLNKIAIRKRIYRFMIYFVLLSGLNYLVYLGFKPSEIDLYRILSIPLGLSIGLAFLDVVFLGEKEI